MTSQRPRVRLLAATLGAALIGPLLGLVPLGPAAQAETTVPTRVTRIDAEFSRSTVPYRGEFTVSGVVEYREADGTEYEQLPAGNGPVVLKRRLEGSSTWRTLQTDGSGQSFAFVATAVGNADYRVVYDGNETYTSTRSTGPVRVTRRMNDQVVEGTLVLRGRVFPDWARKDVVVQVRRSGEWRRLDVVRTDADSRWSKRLYVVSGRRTYFRAFVPATTRFAKSFTDTYYTFVG